MLSKLEHTWYSNTNVMSDVTFKKRYLVTHYSLLVNHHHHYHQQQHKHLLLLLQPSQHKQTTTQQLHIELTVMLLEK